MTAAARVDGAVKLLCGFSKSLLSIHSSIWSIRKKKKYIMYWDLIRISSDIPCSELPKGQPSHRRKSLWVLGLLQLSKICVLWTCTGRTWFRPPEIGIDSDRNDLLNLLDSPQWVQWQGKQPYSQPRQGWYRRFRETLQRNSEESPSETWSTPALGIPAVVSMASHRDAPHNRSAMESIHSRSLYWSTTKRITRIYRKDQLAQGIGRYISVGHMTVAPSIPDTLRGHIHWLKQEAKYNKITSVTPL